MTIKCDKGCKCGAGAPAREKPLSSNHVGVKETAQ